MTMIETEPLETQRARVQAERASENEKDVGAMSADEYETHERSLARFDREIVRLSAAIVTRDRDAEAAAAAAEIARIDGLIRRNNREIVPAAIKATAGLRDRLLEIRQVLEGLAESAVEQHRIVMAVQSAGRIDELAWGGDCLPGAIPNSTHPVQERTTLVDPLSGVQLWPLVQ